MSLAERYQERRDQLAETLGLDVKERLFVQKCYRTDTSARRVAWLINSYVESDSRADRSEFMALLVRDAVPQLRDSLRVMSIDVPDGYEIVKSMRLEALSAVVLQGLSVVRSRGASRDTALSRLGTLCDIATNLDPERSELEVMRGCVNG